MIILVQINYSPDHSEKILPIGILSVGSALKKYGFAVELLNINEKEIDQTVQYISAQNPDSVGISVMTGVQTRHSALLSQKLKEMNKDLPIFWGGIHPSLLPEQCLREDYIDYVIIGEGEETGVEFYQTLTGDRNFSKVLGLGYKEAGKIIINPRRPLIENLDNWRLDFSLLDMNDYVYKLGPYQRTVAYKTSRGCPFGCAFCYNHDFNQSRWRTWSVNSVLADLNFLKADFKIDAIKFYDDNFFVDKERAFKILEAVDLPSHIEIRIDFIDDEVARRLKELKVFDMLIGLESGSERLLKLIDKRFSKERMIAGVKSIAKYDLRATYSFIVGLPTETKAEFKETIDLMYEIYKI
ncbi:MAG: radical SAM protein, partial [Patescibacteria group bacterium]